MFDHVVEYPFYYNMNTRQNDWQLYWASPYEYTIAIDCKSLVFESHDNLWDYLIENHSVCLPTSVLDFRDNVLEYKQLKKYQEEYKLNIACSNLFYFDKSEESVQYFKMLDPICHHWRDAEQSLFQKQHTNKKYYPDLIHTIVANSIPFDVFPYIKHDSFPLYVHRDAIFDPNDTDGFDAMINALKTINDYILYRNNYLKKLLELFRKVPPCLLLRD